MYLRHLDSRQNVADMSRRNYGVLLNWGTEQDSRGVGLSRGSQQSIHGSGLRCQRPQDWQPRIRSRQQLSKEEIRSKITKAESSCVSQSNARKSEIYKTDLVVFRYFLVYFAQTEKITILSIIVREDDGTGPMVLLPLADLLHIPFPLMYK